LPTNWTAYHGPRADAEFVRRAIADIPQFCSFLENRLALENRPAVDFDAHWLTREGLAASKGQFEDYWEPGDWQVMLSPKPQESPSSDDVELKIGISMSAHDELFDELGADWAQYHADWEEHHRTWMAAHDGLSDESAGEDTGWQPHRPLLPAYPLLSRLSEIGTSAVYEPREVNALLAEFFRAQAAAQGPAAIRGLDNLIRIARRAQKLKLGIYFGGRWE
jgi:hypothetical protein